MNKYLLGGVFLVLGSTGLARADVGVSPFRLEESRSVAFKHDDIGHSPDALKLVLSLKGPELADAVRYGKLHVHQPGNQRRRRCGRFD